jgi:hypothetical protein
MCNMRVYDSSHPPYLVCVCVPDTPFTQSTNAHAHALPAIYHLAIVPPSPAHVYLAEAQRHERVEYAADGLRVDARTGKDADRLWSTGAKFSGLFKESTDAIQC